MLAAATRQGAQLGRALRNQPAKACRSLSSSSVSPSSLLLQSQRRVEQQQQRASDELGDIVAKRWLGHAAANGTDADRVSPSACPRR
jgi:N-acetyl-gamma-glutamyl-phosphate reductase/acetylglutamate kinase